MYDVEAVRRVTASDEEIVQRVRAGDAALFEILMRRHNQRLYRVARIVLRDDAEAEDVMQQAYVNAYTHLHQFSGHARFSTWLTRIALHEALARARRRGRVVSLEVEPGTDEEVWSAMTSNDSDPEQQTLRGEVQVLLESSIDALPAGYRSVFVFREVEGLSTAETAECLGVSEEAVKTRLHRARALLRDQLLRRAGVVTSRVFSFHLSRCHRVVAAVLGQLPPSGP